MKKILLTGITVAMTFLSINGFADATQEKIYLVQILNQLNAMQPLVLAAQQAQPFNTRIQFHYTHYRDTDGHLCNGLLDDITAIKKGITEKLNQPAIEPRTVKPIKGDYLDTKSGIVKP